MSHSGVQESHLEELEWRREEQQVEEKIEGWKREENFKKKCTEGKRQKE